MTIVRISTLNNNIGSIQLNLFGFESKEINFEEKIERKCFFMKKNLKTLIKTYEL